MAIVIFPAHQAATADMQAVPPCSGRILPQQTPAMLVALNPTRTRWTGHPGRPIPCLRTTPCRTSCGRPDPSSRRGLRDHDRMFPALSGLRRCRKHNWPTTPIPTRRARQAGHTLVGVLAHWIDSLRIKRVRLVVASRMPTRSLEHLGKPTACLRTMRWRTLCGPPNPAAGVVLWLVAGCFRHCRGNDAVHQTDAAPYTYVRQGHLWQYCRSQRQCELRKTND